MNQQDRDRMASIPQADTPFCPALEQVGRLLTESGGPAELAASGRRVLGLSCTQLPEELPHALGLHPWRVVLRPEPCTRAPSVLQTFCCTWAQALLDQGLAGHLAPLAGLVLCGNTCDSLRSLPEIWRRAGARPPAGQLYSLRLPVLPGGEPALELMNEELSRFVAWLEGLAGEPLRPDRLQASTRLFNRLRAGLRALQELAAAGRISPADLLRSTRAAQTLCRSQVADLLEQAIAELGSPQPSVKGPGAVRVALVGGVLDQERILEHLAAHGARVVADDTCNLERTFEAAADLDPADPLADMARRHLRRTPCPVRAHSADRRAARLLFLVQRRGVQGVIFLPYKGCDPHAFDNVLLARALERRSIPHLTLELDPHLGGWGQMETRLQAFLEMLAPDA